MVLLGGCIKPNWPDIDPGSIDLSDESIRKGIADPSFRAFYQIRQMLSSGLTIRDNFNAAIVKIPCIHGVEVPFSKGTINGLPIAFTPLATSLSTGGVALPVAGTPSINYSRSDGYLGLTVNFAPPAGLVLLYKNSNQAVPTTTITAVNWDGETAVSGSLTHSITTNTSRVTCLETGFVEVLYSMAFTADASNSRSMWTARNGDAGALNRRRAQQVLPPLTAGYNSNISAGCIWDVTAGDYLEAIVYHNSVTSPLNLLGGGFENATLQARYVAPPVGYSASVTGILWGG